MFGNDGLSIFGDTRIEDSLMARANMVGRTYYVNNITGDDGNSGLSWGAAFAQPSKAISESETFRQLGGGAPLVDTNDYIRNTIFIQGTGTAYTKLTALPSYCNMIGIGAGYSGHGDGIPRIGADAGNNDGVLVAGTARGLHIHNLQFQAGTDKSIFKVTNLYRVLIEDCGFFTCGEPPGEGAPAVGLEVDKASGLVVRRCHWGCAHAKTSFPLVGISVTGTHFHNSIIEDCYIVGQNQGILIDISCINGYGSIVRNNYIGYGGETCTTGISDNSATNGAHIIYAGNYINATAPIYCYRNGTGRCIGNIAEAAFVSPSGS